MTQNREAPAFQEYAATMLAKLPFRLMTMEERGLFYTMRLECWINEKLPISPESLSIMFGKAVSASSLKAVMPFFRISDDHIVCPELDDYRAHLNEIRRKQSEGGKSGADITNSKRKSGASSGRAGNPPSIPKAPRRVGNESLVQSSTEKKSQDQLIGNEFNYLDERGRDPLLYDLPSCRN